jgi:hypothetical protein
VQQPVQQPITPAAVEAIYKEAPISTGGYIGILLLMLIPVLNLLLLIVWACGGCNRQNKRNLSRALLIWMLVGAILGGIVFLAGSYLFGDRIDVLKEWGSSFGVATPVSDSDSDSGTGAETDNIITDSPGLWDKATAILSGNRAESAEPAEMTGAIPATTEPVDWLSGDFKLALDEVSNIPAMAMTGAGGEKVRKSAIKVKDQLFYTTTEGGLKQVLYRIEDGAVVSYLLVPEVKKALRTVSNWTSLEAILKSELGASVWSEHRNPDELTEAGTEEIAGIKCIVYKIDDDKADERKKEFQKEADGFAALAKALGGDTKEIDAMKERFGGVGGTAKWWIDPARQKFVARRHINMKGVNGKAIDMVTHNVTFFAPGTAHASEIPDMSEYTIQ